MQDRQVLLAWPGGGDQHRYVVVAKPCLRPVDDLGEHLVALDSHMDLRRVEAVRRVVLAARLSQQAADDLFGRDR